MKKKLLLLAGILSISMFCCSCGKSKDEATKNLDRRSDYDVSAAKGNIEKTEKPEKPEEITMPITFVNNTGTDIYYLYASTTDTDDWEEDILDVDVLEYGEYVRVDFTFLSTDTIWDFAVEDNSDNRLEFYDLDFSKYGKEGAAIVLNSDGTANITRDADDFELPEVSVPSYQTTLEVTYEFVEDVERGLLYSNEEGKITDSYGNVIPNYTYVQVLDNGYVYDTIGDYVIEGYFVGSGGKIIFREPGY